MAVMGEQNFVTYHFKIDLWQSACISSMDKHKYITEMCFPIFPSLIPGLNEFMKTWNE